MIIKDQIFFTIIESEESVAKTSPVAQFALPLNMKPSRQDSIVTWSVLYSTFNKQIWEVSVLFIALSTFFLLWRS